MISHLMSFIRNALDCLGIPSYELAREKECAFNIFIAQDVQNLARGIVVGTTVECDRNHTFVYGATTKIRRHV